MLNIIKNSFNIVVRNYTIPLFFVLFLTLITFTSSKLALMPTILGLFTIGILIIFLCAFFAGWYGMIKSAVVNSYKKRTKAEELRDIFSLKGDFLGYVGSHILPVFLGFVLYFILAVLVFNLSTLLAEKFVGNIDFLYNDTKNIVNSSEALAKYVVSLPKEKLMLLAGWELVLLVSVGLFNLFTLFWFSDLYMNKTDSRNILKALWSSICAVFKKPLSVIGFNVLVASFYFLVSQSSILGRLHPVLSFIYMVLWVYFFVFINVLIFNYYGKNFGNIGDTGANSFGKNEISA